MAKTQKSDEEWRKQLSDDEYKVLRGKGTEVPFSGEFVYSKDEGMYTCKACGAQLFHSKSKYDSNEPGLAGWPSFSDALPGAVEFTPDNNLSMSRTEVTCANCGSHLGHIFEDSSSETNQHYCINSVCLKFNPESAK